MGNHSTLESLNCWKVQERTMHNITQNSTRQQKDFNIEKYANAAREVYEKC
jgi:hypothetical protein